MLAEVLIKEAVENTLNQIKDEELHALERCCIKTSGSNDIAYTLRNYSKTHIVSVCDTTKRIEELIELLQLTIKNWDFSNKLDEIEENLVDRGILIECHYDFNLNKWKIVRKIEGDKDFSIWFSTFDKMKDYMLSEMR